MKKYDLIYFVGDSWTVAHITDGVLPEPQPKETLFTYLVANYFNIPYIVDANGGVSNEWIHRTAVNGIEKFVTENKKILLIIGWSDPSRREMFSNELRQSISVSEISCSLDWYKEYVVKYFDYDFQSEITIALRKSIRGLCHAFDIDYIECSAFTPFTNISFLDKNQMLEEHWSKICGEEGRIFVPNTLFKYGHQNKLGQEKIANALINKIIKTYG